MKQGVIRKAAGVTLGLLLLGGCKGAKHDEAAEAPPRPVIQEGGDAQSTNVDHPERFTLVTARQQNAGVSLNVTGSVNPDVSQTIPVISLANGRVLDLHVRLGDYVRKGQLLFEVQSSDISNAFDLYLKAVNDERLARAQFERSKILYDKGATPKSQLEIAENAELDAKTDLTAAQEQLQVLGVDRNKPSLTARVYAPADGVIISQNVTNAAAAGVSLAGSSTAFTIANLSHVWVIVDVYENDLRLVHLGGTAQIHLSAYPDRTFVGSISDIGAVLDPSLRTAKVRIQVNNPDMLLRIGMFATAVLSGSQQTVTVVPANAVLHLQDRDWVFLPTTGRQFRRVEVRSGAVLSGNEQEILAGLEPGQQVAAQALALQNSAAQ